MTMSKEVQRLQQFEFGIWYALSLWPALSLAVAENWGGPDSKLKRDWFAGQISELFESDPETEAIDVEERLLQIMQDEFEVAVDDESAAEVAERIIKLSQSCKEGNFQEVDEMKAKWERKKDREGDIGAGFHRIETTENDQDTDGDDEQDEDRDIEMDEAPELVRAPREKPVPEVDEHGFTTVVSKKKR